MNRIFTVAIGPMMLAFAMVGCGSLPDAANHSAKRTDTGERQAAHDPRQPRSYTYLDFSNILYQSPNGRRYSYAQIDHNHWHFYDPRVIAELRRLAEAAEQRAAAELRKAEAIASLTAEQRAALQLARQRLVQETANIQREQSQAEQQKKFVKLVINELRKIEIAGVTKPSQMQAVKEYLDLAKFSASDRINMKVDPIAAGAFSPRASHLGERQAVAFSGGNVTEFIAFLEQNKQDVVVGNAAHEALLQLLDDAARTFGDWHAAQRDLDENRKRRIEARHADIRKIIEEINTITEQAEQNDDDWI